MHGIIEDSINASSTSFLESPRIKTRRQKPVRLADIATAAGVSIATVSMVLNDNPRISAATQQRVRRIVQRMGYQPLHAAQVLAARKSTVLAVLVPAMPPTGEQRSTLSDAYFAELIGGICERAATLGHTVQLERVTPDFIKRKNHLALLDKRAVGGLLLVGSTDQAAFIDEFDPTLHPVVVVDNRIERTDVDDVGCDYRGGTQQAMNYLMQLGHRRIGLINSAASGRNVRDSSSVYRAMMTEQGIRPSEGYIVDGQSTESGGAEAAEKLLRRHGDVTAILAASDTMAIGAMHAALKIGKSVPRDLSIVGMDNLRHGAFMNPALTSVQLPLHACGARACQRLIERMNGDRSEAVHDRLATHLILRSSAAMMREASRANSAA
jgi:LacI family transcriptional regulator